MTLKKVASIEGVALDEAAATSVSPPVRKREYTTPATQGGSYGEDGTLLHQTQPEPDDHRMKQAER